jgi:hypothetical protein
VTANAPYLGTPETEDKPEPTWAKLTRIDFDGDEQPDKIHIVASPAIAHWIGDRYAEEIREVFQLGHAVYLQLDASTTRRMHATAGRQLPVTHESSAVYECLGNIINRFEDD